MQWETPTQIFARQTLTKEGWQRDVLIAIQAGKIAAVQAGAKPPAGAPVYDLVLPGMSNVHSHAFQRAMAGLTEIASGKGQDNFWSWREVMYGFLQRFTPEDVQDVARALYIELLKQGYTAVGEFHYLHNDPNGAPYAAPSELSDRIIAAAQETGIHLTHLPVMYETGNFGGTAPTAGQKRFLHTQDSYLSLIHTLVKKYGNTAGVTLGVAPHSLRAVTPETLQAVVHALPDGPVHIHVAEQEKEVADCLSWSGQRPVEWLLEHCAVDARWCTIHATHMTPEETKRLAASGATAGLCPTTEANLGDGIFPATAYAQAGGQFGIGSDSNVCVSPWEELKLMEYAQRLQLRKRNVLYDLSSPSVGRTLYSKAAKGGAKALGIAAGEIAAGTRADLIVLSTDHPLLANRQDDALLDTLIFGVTPTVTDVFVAGAQVVQNGRHVLEEESNRVLSLILHIK